MQNRNIVVIFVPNSIVMKKYKINVTSGDLVSEAALSYTSSPRLSYQNINIRTIHTARAGINMVYLLQLKDKMDLNLTDLGHILNVSLRTLQRYELDYTFDAASSSIIMQLNMLIYRGLDVFGNQASFNAWLKSPVPELGDSTPLDVLDTPFGFQLVFQILGRIEHGVFA